jgi:hypothetical protein
VPEVHELKIPEFAAVKLGRRGISAVEARQLPRNPYRMAPNPRERGLPKQLRRRLILVGETNGGRTLTLVVERTPEPTDWLVITGWDSNRRVR